MKIILLGIVCTMLVGGVFYFYRRDTQEEKNNNTNAAVIVAFGDSLVAGYGATKGNDFVSVLGKEISRAIINEGVSGDTTESAQLRIEDVRAHKPDVVIVLLGGNDFLRGVPKKVFKQNLEKIVKTLTEDGSQVVLVGIKAGLLNDTYEGVYEEVSEKYDTAYIPHALKGIITDRSLMFDVIHPNDKGYAILVDRVKEVLEELL